jgi:hypothetical protein
LSSHTGGGVEVADVALDGADGAEAPRRRRSPEGLRQRRDLDGIAKRRCGAVRLDVGDRAGIDPGQRVRRGDHLGLTVDAGGGETDLA